MEIKVPGYGLIKLSSLMLDYNGTIASDGRIIEGVAERLERLKGNLDIYVLTADTRGTAAETCRELPVVLKTFPGDAAAESKEEITRGCGADTAVCIGNGRNDVKMFDAAALSIAVIEKECAYGPLLAHADIISRSICEALDLLIDKDRIVADLRG